MKTWGLRIALATALVCGAVSPLGAQQKKPPKPSPPPKAAAGKPGGGGGGRPGGAAAKAPNPTQELDRFSKMSPQEREKALSKLPPQRRAVFEQNLARYESLTPEQRERVKQRVEEMESLPKDRQNAVKQEIQRLRALPFGQKRAYFNSEEFRQKYSPDEQNLILEPFPNFRKQKED